MVDNNLNITLENPASKNFADVDVGENIEEVPFLAPISSILKDTIMGKPADKKEILLNTEDNNLYIGITTSVLKDKGGNINGAVAIFKDLTEIKERALLALAV